MGRLFSLGRLLGFLVASAFVLAACGADTNVASLLFDPTETDEAKPDSYRESLPRDAINPIYEPTFVSRADVDWGLDELVIGVDIGGEARAYPVGLLTWREIVVDDHRGIPTLVTW